MLHNSNNRLKQFTEQQEKKLKSDFNNSTMYWKVEIEFSINDNTKSSQI